MELYMNGQKYSVERDLSTVNKRQAIIEILNAINEMRIPLEDIWEVIPFSFIGSNPVSVSDIDSNAWEYLNSIITKSIKVGIRVQERDVTSKMIFKEAHKFLKDLEWVYTMDSSYNNIMARQFNLPLSDDYNSIPFLVPKSFTGLNLETFITESKTICQVNETGFSIEKL